MFHLLITLPPFPPDPVPAMLRRALALLAWLYGHGVFRPAALGGLAAVLLPRQLSLVFDVEQDPPVLLGRFYGTAGDGNVILYDDQRGGGGAIPAPADCVEVVDYAPVFTAEEHATLLCALCVAAANYADDRMVLDLLAKVTTPEIAQSYADGLHKIQAERAKLVDDVDEVERLRDATKPIPNRDGWRIDAEGREWYSAQWLGLKS